MTLLSGGFAKRLKKIGDEATSDVSEDKSYYIDSGTKMLEPIKESDSNEGLTFKDHSLQELQEIE